MSSEVKDLPEELMQRIQSLLPVTEAARTSVLSKPWLHAWSTIPNLRFYVFKEEHTNEKIMRLEDVDRTLIRYRRDNIPIEMFDFLINIENHESASHAEKWLGPMVTKPCLKQLHLSFLLCGAPFTLPDEILSSENLTKVKVSSPVRHHQKVCMTTRVINCVSLRELHLDGVCISEEALHNILSYCTLLENIVLLDSCKGFETIKVKNLHRLYELTISSKDNVYGASSTALEISNVPNLGLFSCNLPFSFSARSISLGSNVTELTLGGHGMVTDKACLEMIESGFPFLESLTLDAMESWMSESFHFTCASIKRLSLHSCLRMLTDVQVHAPKLLFYSFDGTQLPSLLFPVSSTLRQMIVALRLDSPLDVDFFLKLREVLTLSRECNVYIRAAFNSMVPLDIDSLRTRLVLPPAKNVQQLLFGTIWDECMWERSPFFDAFFEICHPKQVFADPDRRLRHNNHFCRVMLREVLEKKTTTAPYWAHYLEHVRIRENFYEKWEDLTDSHRSFLDGSAPNVYLCFNLKWG